MEFGMYKGKTLKGVEEAIARKSGAEQSSSKFKEYLSVLVAMGWPARKPAFQAALEEAGIWPEMCEIAPRTQKAVAERAIRKQKESTEARHEHREVKLLRKLQADQAVAILDELGDVVPVEGEPPEEQTFGPPKKEEEEHTEQSPCRDPPLLLLWWGRPQR